MFLLLLHPLDSWKVAMIFVGNIINRVTFLFSLLFSFYWSCQKFSSSCCWRIIALSWCQIKLAKCLNLSISADLISLSRAGQLTAAAEVWVRARANPLISAGDDHWAPPPSPPAPIQHMVRNGQRVWPSPPHPVIHAAQNGLLPNPNEVVIDDILSAQYIFCISPKLESLGWSHSPTQDLMIEWIFFTKKLFLHTPFELSSC